MSILTIISPISLQSYISSLFILGMPCFLKRILDVSLYTTSLLEYYILAS